MRNLKFRIPHRIDNSIIRHDNFQDLDQYHYSRGASVLTKFGVVVFADMVWEHNLGVDRYSIFSTVLNGRVHTATLNEGKLSDRQIKWISTHFIKKLIQNQ